MSIEIKGLCLEAGGKVLLDDVSMSFPDRGFYAIVGESGCGKTTFLECLAGMRDDYRGEVLLDGRELGSLGEEERSSIRFGAISYISQSFDLLELDTVYENVALSLGEGDDGAKELIFPVLKSLGLFEKRKRRCRDLSGGEKQRVAVAIALCKRPSYILADEPTGSLDKENREIIYKAFKKASTNCLTIVVTHDEEGVRKYADGIIKHRDGKLEGTLAKRERGRYMEAIPHRKYVSPFYWLRHACRNLLGKKRRNALYLSLLSFSFASFGSAVYLLRDMEGEISSSMASLMGSNAIVVKSRDETLPMVGNTYSAPEEEVASMASSNPSLIEGYGVSYLDDLDSFFPDSNTIYISYRHYPYEIEGLSIQSLVDYRWLGEENVLPENPPSMEDDQIVLGLDYKTMFGIASRFGIYRDFPSVARFLVHGGISLTLDVANEGWAYSDQESFRIVGLVESEAPMVFHRERMWNRWLIETKMRFHPKDAETKERPWDFQYAYYLKAYGNPNFLMEMRDLGYLDRYILDKEKYPYMRSVYRPGEASKGERYYVFSGDKNSIEFPAAHEIVEFSSPSGSFFGADGSYLSFPSSMMMGFSSRFFLSSDVDELESVYERINYLKKEYGDIDPGIKEEKVLQGYYLLPGSSSLTISSDFSSLVEGRKPQSIDEVCLSREAYDLLGEAKTVYCAFPSVAMEVGDYLERVYNVAPLRVVGVIEESGQRMHVTPHWCLDFFAERLGVSSFSLEPSSLIMEYREGVDKSPYISSIEEKYYDYLAVDPTLLISGSIDEVTNEIGLSVLIGSIMALFASSILSVSICRASLKEGEGEGKSLYRIGYSRQEIGDEGSLGIFLLGLAAFLISSLSLFFIELALHHEVSSSFGGNARFAFDPVPLLAIAACLLAFLALVALLSYLFVHRRSYVRKEK